MPFHSHFILDLLRSLARKVSLCNTVPQILRTNYQFTDILRFVLPSSGMTTGWTHKKSAIIRTLAIPKKI